MLRHHHLECPPDFTWCSQAHPMDPLMERLSQFRSGEDLEDSITALFHKTDVDHNGSVSFREMHEGFKENCNLYVSQDDWQDMKKCLGMHGDGLSIEEFRVLIVEQLKVYLLNNVNKAIITQQAETKAMLPILKWILISIDKGNLTCSQKPRIPEGRGDLQVSLDAQGDPASRPPLSTPAMQKSTLLPTPRQGRLSEEKWRSFKDKHMNDADTTKMHQNGSERPDKGEKRGGEGDMERLEMKVDALGQHAHVCFLSMVAEAVLLTSTSAAFECKQVPDQLLNYT